ncbi:hypothetical protein E5D57_012541 [Metarhizium anisopliae]|nr:hypothetical protein E5D57_012541 [Metarhizium anisopliae]
MGGIGAWGAWGLGRRARSASVQPACKRTKTGQDDRLALPHATPRHATATPPLGYLDTSSNILPKAMPSKLNLEISTIPFSPCFANCRPRDMPSTSYRYPFLPTSLAE